MDTKDELRLTARIIRERMIYADHDDATRAWLLRLADRYEADACARAEGSG